MNNVCSRLPSIAPVVTAATTIAGVPITPKRMPPHYALPVAAACLQLKPFHDEAAIPDSAHRRFIQTAKAT